MLEQEPHRPNYDELKKAREAAQQPQPGKQPDLQANPPDQRNYSELKAAHSIVDRQTEERKPPLEPLRVNAGDDPEAKMEAYRKELQIKFERGEIDRSELVRREKLYDQQLASAIKSTPAGQALVLPDPQPARTDRQWRFERQEVQPDAQQPVAQQGAQQLVIKPMDWERMLTDPAYRKEMEQQSREKQALRLRQTEQEQGTARERTGSGGRER